jgi:hypothetical protein
MRDGGHRDDAIQLRSRSPAAGRPTAGADVDRFGRASASRLGISGVFVIVPQILRPLTLLAEMDLAIRGD